MDEIVKPLIWIGSSKEDLLDLPRKVQREVGYAFYLYTNKFKNWFLAKRKLPRFNDRK